MGKEHSAKAFTLIELLVVISIISVLLALLMPVLSSARSRARLVVCASNLHQNYISLDTYAKENNDCWPRTDYGSHTNQFYRINSPDVHGPLYYLWLAGFVEEPKTWYCPGSSEKPEQTWQQNGNGNYKPVSSMHGAGYQFRMRLAFYNSSGRKTVYKSARKKNCYGQLRPDNFRKLVLWSDAFGHSENRIINHKTGQWNVLFNDSSVKTRDDKRNIIPQLNLSWSQAGDWRLLLPNGKKDSYRHMAFLWHFFDKNSWEIENKSPRYKP
ncbi:MAG: type II secretion system GspH family protein [Anaerohalosphaeraceae bacterium]|nr:type II secretion system GspH family protein [Anaerohalosphaeraceae bacterium]